MPNPLAKRLTFWKDIYFGWVRVGVALFITVSTVVLALRDLFVAPEHKDFSFFKYIPQWPWYVWLIAGLTGLLLLTLESSYNKSQRDRVVIRGHLRTRLKERDERHKADLLSAQFQGFNQPLISPVPSTDESLIKTDEAPQLEPNIVTEAPELSTVHQSQSNSVIVEGTERGREQEMMLANVVPYRNLVKEGKPIGVARNITGRAVYRRYGTIAPITKERIAWLSEDHPRVFFERNDVRRLILAVQNLSDQICIVQRDVSGTGRETRYTVLADGLYSVWVTLMNEVDGRVKNRSEFILEVKHAAPSVKFNLQEAKRWRALRLKDFHGKLSILFDSYKLQITADDPPGAAETLASVIDRDMLECKAFVREHFEDFKANGLGYSLSEYGSLSSVNRALAGVRSHSELMAAFLERLNKLRATG
jgi:hypothetical protein